MLNRIKYILIVAIIGASLVKPALAAHDSTISYININNKVFEDVELVVSDGAQILVPFKQLANIVEITYSANRVDKVIEFVKLSSRACSNIDSVSFASRFQSTLPYGE